MRLYSLKRLDLPDDQKDDLEVVTEEISNIENLIRDFLELSRPIKLKTEKITPSDVVDKAARLLRPDLEYRKIQLLIHRSERLSEILIDAEQLKEVLVNLVINGSETIGNGKGSVTIHEKEIVNKPFGRWAVIEVHDNGEGIPDPIQAKIFEPFFTIKKEGTGLGLSIAKQIVEAHGGNLTLNSREGEGSTFTLALPCCDR